MKKQGEGENKRCGKIVERGSRLFLSLLISAGIFWFGIVFTPSVNLGLATVTDRTVNPRLARQSIPGTAWEGAREFRINGGRIAIERGKTGKTNASDLWPILKKYSGDIVAGGEKEGFLAGFPIGREQAVKLLARGSDVGSLVSAFLVLPRKGSGADLFAFSASGLGLSNFLAPGGNDAPGRDPDDLPRLPLSRRLISIQSTGAPPLLQVAVYRYPGSSEAARRFFLASLAREGWETPEKGDKENLLNFRRENSLLSIGIHPDPESSVLITAAIISQ